MQVLEFEPFGYASNCFLLYDPEHGKSLLLDAAVSPERLQKVLNEIGCELSAILLTHGHYDHILALPRLQQVFNCPTYIHKADLPALDAGNMANVDWLFSLHFEGAKAKALPKEHLQIADLDIEIIETPGHTAGSVIYHIGDVFFTGDTLLPGSCGRYDLPTGDGKTLMQSLKLFGRILQAQTKAMLYPGHGSATPAGDELKRNFYLI